MPGVWGRAPKSPGLPPEGQGPRPPRWHGWVAAWLGDVLGWDWERSQLCPFASLGGAWWSRNAAAHPRVAIGELISGKKKKQKKSCRNLTEVLQAIDACLKSGWFCPRVSHRARGSCAIGVNVCWGL